jgi:hypothetical protein
MLADGRRAARTYLVLALTVIGLATIKTVSLSNGKDVVGHDLAVIWDVLRRNNDVEDDPARGRIRAIPSDPWSQTSCRELRSIRPRASFDPGLLQTVGHSAGLPVEALDENRPLPFLVEDRED